MIWMNGDDTARGFGCVLTVCGFFFFFTQWKEFFSSTRIVKAAKVSQDERWRLSSFNPLPISIMSPARWQPPHPTAAANCLPPPPLAPRPTVRQFFFLLRLFEQCFHSMPSAEINSIPRVERVRFRVFCLGNV